MYNKHVWQVNHLKGQVSVLKSKSDGLNSAVSKSGARGRTKRGLPL